MSESMENQLEEQKELNENLMEIRQSLLKANLKIQFLDERLKKIENDYNIIQDLSSSILLIQQEFTQMAKTMTELKNDIAIDVKEIKQNQTEQSIFFQESISAQNCKISHLETDFLERIKDIEMSPARNSYSMSVKLKEKIILAVVMGVVFALLAYLFPFISWK